MAVSKKRDKNNEMANSAASKSVPILDELSNLAKNFGTFPEELTKRSYLNEAEALDTVIEYVISQNHVSDGEKAEQREFLNLLVDTDPDLRDLLLSGVYKK